jgi:YgiT-type zinc finger domain-containing protein
MTWPSKCPLCSGEIVEKEVEKILKGGNDTATVRIFAGVCLKCGEHLYIPADVKRFENIRENLKNNRIKDFKVVGKAYAIA